MIPFIITAAVLTFALPPVVHCVYDQGWIQSMPSFLYQTTWVISLFTIILFVYLFRSQKASYFVQLYLLSMVVKLIAYLVYNLIVILEDRGGAAVNVVYFLLVYFLFTGVEIGFLYRKISASSRP